MVQRRRTTVPYASSFRRSGRGGHPDTGTRRPPTEKSTTAIVRYARLRRYAIVRRISLRFLAAFIQAGRRSTTDITPSVNVARSRSVALTNRSSRSRCAEL